MVTRRTDPKTLLSGEPEYELAEPDKKSANPPTARVKDPLSATGGFEDDDEEQEQDAGDGGIELPEAVAQEPVVPAALRGVMSIAQKSSEEPIGASEGGIPEADAAPSLAAPPTRTRSVAKAAAPIAGSNEAEAPTSAAQSAEGEENMAGRPKQPPIEEIPWRRGPRAEDAWMLPQWNDKHKKWEGIPMAPKTPGAFKVGARAARKPAKAAKAAAPASAPAKVGRPRKAAPATAEGNGHAKTNLELLQEYQAAKAVVLQEIEDFKTAKLAEAQELDGKIAEVRGSALEDMKKQQEQIAAAMKALGA